MPEPLYVFVNFILLFIKVMSVALMIRAIIDWFFESDGKLYRFLYIFTEPTLMPFRKLFVKLNWFQDSSVDVSFTFTYAALYFLDIIFSSMV